MSSIIQHSISYDVDLLALHERHPHKYPCLLESVAHGPQGRYDILFACPQESFQIDVNQINQDDFLQKLDNVFSFERIYDKDESGLPFRGGWFVFLSYELAQQIEPVLDLPLKGSDLPIAAMTRVPAAVIKDHLHDRAVVVLEGGHSELLAEILADLQSAVDTPDFPCMLLNFGSLVEEDSQRYQEQLAKIHQYIVDGDVFQVNLSRLWQVELAERDAATQVYRRLRKSNPSPFAALLNWKNHYIISSSPERLLSVNDGMVETRPIAGTRPRREGDDEAQRLAELISHPKERAEHVMLIDLERNDLGRVCVPGSVEVNELMTLESYAHVHHIVSNVRGRLKPNTSPGEVIAAVFPGGTITGCPKVRCMEIIAELEQTRRGAYTGSVGYINRNGDMDLNILIRTMTLSASGVLNFRAGGGIVVDSNLERELEETRAKAKGMIKVLDEHLG